MTDRDSTADRIAPDRDARERLADGDFDGDSTGTFWDPELTREYQRNKEAEIPSSAHHPDHTGESLW